ncbi:MAG: cobalamin biosynthesis protein [Pseudomonadota bacterium]
MPPPDPSPAPVILSLTASAAPLAGRLAQDLGAQHLTPAPGTVGAEIRALFQAGAPIVGVCAAGILIRGLGPILGDKRHEPPVLAVAEDGSTVVPLLGGHHGANVLARRVADLLAGAGRTAITTAGDLRLGVALDDPPDGWHLDNPEDVKYVTAALLAGSVGALSGQAPFLDPLPDTVARQPAPDPGAPVVLRVGARALIYRRRTVALGVGCIRGCDPVAMIGHAARCLADWGIAQGEVAAIHSIDLKADEAAVHALAAHLGVPARFHAAAALEAETPRLTAPSDTVFAEVGCHGVAEGAALAAAGPKGGLIGPKAKTPQATCAAARIGAGGAPGRARGRLSVVGIGPGAADWRTPEATAAILRAEELVGYGRYLDLLGPLAPKAKHRAFDLGQEEARCRYALEAAGAGRDIALICSGDGGIYAMGALVAELLDRPADAGGVSDAARRVEVVNIPGISALQAASARAGALLGHDFCAISLSDLLTERQTILNRIAAAAAGDFVIAFYNPVSRRRRTLLAEAREMLLRHRPPDTPVLLAADLGRPAETLRRRTLATLKTEEVDMLTTVIVGASASRAFQTGDHAAGAQGWRLYTPRGYARKLDGKAAE